MLNFSETRTPLGNLDFLKKGWQFFSHYRQQTDRFIQDAKTDPESGAQTALLLESILSDIRYRMTAYAFLHYAHRIPEKEKAGLILFTGLVGMADDAVDHSPHIISHNPAESRENIFRQTVPIHSASGDSEKPITLDTAHALTLKHFSPEKQAIIDAFLEHALETESLFPHRKPGEYTFAEALEYRRQTSGKYSETIADLAEVAEPFRTDTLVFGDAIQILDDSSDVLLDYQNDSMNPFIALAHENQEQEALTAAASRQTSKKSLVSSFARMIRTKRVLKRMPETRKQYLALFENEAGKITNKNLRKTASFLGERFL